MRLALVVRFVVIFVLSFPSVILAQKAKASTHQPLIRDYSFTIKANRVWTDTGLDLAAGDRIHILGPMIGCDGPTPNEKAHLPLPSAPGGALLAKLQPEAPPISASPDAVFPIIAPGHLYLGVNGWQCHGTIPAKVRVEGQETATAKP